MNVHKKFTYDPGYFSQFSYYSYRTTQEAHNSNTSVQQPQRPGKAKRLQEHAEIHRLSAEGQTKVTDKHSVY